MRFRRKAIELDLPHPGQSRKRRGAVVILPSLFTLGNLICGFTSLHYSSKGMIANDLSVSNFSIAGYLIFAGMFFDLFDGFFARLVKASSNFGAELDSLADMVSFGVAPAFLVLKLVASKLGNPNEPLYEALGPNADDVMGRLFWVIGAAYVACTALRLARFNVFNTHEAAAHQAFRGLPSPGAAAVVASTVIFVESLQASKHFLWAQVPDKTGHFFSTIFPYALPFLLLGSALLMVSGFTYAHLVNRFLRGRKRFNYLLIILLIIMSFLWQPQISALLFIYIYAMSAPVAALYRKATGKKLRNPASSNTPPANN